MKNAFKSIGVLDFGPKTSGFIISYQDKIILEHLIPIYQLEKQLQKYIQEYKIEHLFIGLPLDIDNKPTKQSKLITTKIHSMRHSLCKYTYICERNTTKKSQFLQNYAISNKPIDILSAYNILNNIKRLNNNKI